MWYENSNLEHIGFLEFGYNSITEIEVYRHKVTGKLYFCDHDDPDEDSGLRWVKECVQRCNDPKYDDQVAHAEQVLGMKLR